MSGIFNTVQHNKCQKVKKIKGKSVICKARALTSSEFQRIVLGVFLSGFWMLPVRCIKTSCFKILLFWGVNNCLNIS